MLGVGLGLPLTSAALLVLSRVPAWARDESVALACFTAVAGLAVLLAHTDARRLLPVMLSVRGPSCCT